MSESNACSLRSRRHKLQEDHQIIQQTLGNNMFLNTDQLSGTNEVSEVLKKFLQYRSNYTKHKDIEMRIEVFAFNLYCSKPQIYRHLKPILGLPDENLFQNFTINLTPKFENSALYFLSSKLNSLRPEMNHFVLCVDSIKLNRNYVYDTKRDTILGFHNISDSFLNQSATDAYVILLRSVRMNWVQLVAYAFISERAPLHHCDDLARWCVKVITHLLQVGIKVNALLTRPNSITGEKSYLDSGIHNSFTFLEDKTVYELHDIRLSIETVRNCLIENDLYVNDSRISWHYIKLLYYQEKDFKDSSLIPEITAAHVHPSTEPSTQSSRLKKAYEIFSMNVYHAFDRLINAGVLPLEARATADFVKMMSDLCDIVNHSQKSYKKFSINHQIKVLRSTLKTFNNIQERNIVPPAIVLMRKSLSGLSNYLQNLKKQGLRHVYISRLNKAPLDAFFRRVPRVVKNGKKLRPTASQVVTAFRREFIENLKKRVPRAERLEDIAEAARCGLLDAHRVPRAALPSRSALRLPFPNSHYRIQIPKTTVTDVYIASFLLYKCMEVHDCPELNDYLRPRRYLLDQKNTLFRHFRSLNRSCDFYDQLLVPPVGLVKYVRGLLDVYAALLRRNVSQAVGARLLWLLGREPLTEELPCRCFPTQLLLKLFVRLHIFQAVQYSNSKLQRGNQQRRQRGVDFFVPRFDRKQL